MARGKVAYVAWETLCKDCARAGRGAEFKYPDSWAQNVISRGGSRSNRCPACRKLHARDAASMAVPYLDLDVIGRVDDPQFPTGPLGGLGPLPVEHKRIERTRDLSEHTIALEDSHVMELLQGLSDQSGKRVAVVVAGTGTGKSTFLPYRLLHPPTGAPICLADNGPIIVTEPRILAAKQTAAWVAQALHGSHLGMGSEIGYRAGGESAFDGASRLLYVTDGALINWIRDGKLSSFGAIVIDEAHERSRNIDILLGLLREALPRYSHLRVLIASATIDGDFFEAYFGGSSHVYRLDLPSAKTWGYGEPLWPEEDVNLDHTDWARSGPRGEDLRALTAEYAKLRLQGTIEINSWLERMAVRVADQVVKILKGTSVGDILAFLPGRTTIKDAIKRVRRLVPDDVMQLDIYPLLATTQKDIQEAACRSREPGARRRVVVATNVAETSVTIEGMTFVVDSGLICQKRWDPETASGSLPAVPHSRDGVRQRWGRVGRGAPGWVFPLYSRAQYESFEAHTPPESCRDDLEKFVLSALASGVDDPQQFVWPMAFERDAEEPEEMSRRSVFRRELARANQALRQRGVIDEDRYLTPLGKEIERSSCEASEAIALILADRLACAIEVLAVVTALSGPQLLVGDLLRFKKTWSAGVLHVVQQRHLALMEGCRDDLDLLLKVLGGWQAALEDTRWGEPPEKRRSRFAEYHMLSHDFLQSIDATMSEKLGPLLLGKKSRKLRNVDPRLADRVRAVLTAALPDRVWVRTPSGWKPELEADWNRAVLVPDRPWVRDLQRAIAWKRVSLPGGRVLLDHLVEATAGVPRIASSHDLESAFWAIALSNAELPSRGLSNCLSDHWIGQSPSLLGARVQIISTGESLAVGELLEPPRDLKKVLDEEIAAQEAQEEESEAPEDDQSEAVADLQYGDGVEPVILNNEEEERRFELIENMADSDAVGEMTAKVHRQLPANHTLESVADGPDGTVCAESWPPGLGLTAKTGTLAVGSHKCRVVGFRGVGTGRAAVIEPMPNDTIAAKLGTELETSLVEIGAAWSGSPYGVFKCEQVSAVIVVDAEMAALDPYDRGCFDALAQHEVSRKVMVIREYPDLGVLEGTLLPQLARELLTWAQLKNKEGGLPARVLSSSEGWVRVELDGEVPMVLRGTRLSIREKILHAAGVPILADTPLYIEKIEVNERGCSKSFNYDGMEKAAQNGKGVNWDNTNQRLLVSSPPLPWATFAKVAQQVDSVQHQRGLFNLWVDGHRMYINKVAGRIDDTALGGRQTGVIKRTMTDSIIVQLTSGAIVKVTKNAVSPGGRTSPKLLFAAGDTVDVVLSRSASGMVEALPHSQSSSQAVVEGTELWGLVSGTTNFGLFVHTAAGAGLIHKSKITKDYFNPVWIKGCFPVGAPVRVRVEEFDNGKLELGLVELLYQDGSRVRGLRSNEPADAVAFIDDATNWRDLATLACAFTVECPELWSAVAGLEAVKAANHVLPGTALRLIEYAETGRDAVGLKKSVDRLDQVVTQVVGDASVGLVAGLPDFLREVSRTMGREEFQQWMRDLNGQIDYAVSILENKVERVEKTQREQKELVKHLNDVDAWLISQEHTLEPLLQSLKEQLILLERKKKKINDQQKLIESVVERLKVTADGAGPTIEALERAQKQVATLQSAIQSAEKAEAGFKTATSSLKKAATEAKNAAEEAKSVKNASSSIINATIEQLKTDILSAQSDASTAVKLGMKSLSQSESEKLKTASAKINTCSVKFEKEGGQWIVIISVCFTVNGLLGFNGQVAAYFSDGNGNDLVNKIGKYKTSKGTVAISGNYIADAECFNEENFQLSIPLSELNAESKSTVKITIIVWTNPVTSCARALARNENLKFTLT